MVGSSGRAVRGIRRRTESALWRGAPATAGKTIVGYVTAGTFGRANPSHEAIVRTGSRYVIGETSEVECVAMEGLAATARRAAVMDGRAPDALLAFTAWRPRSGASPTPSAR